MAITAIRNPIKEYEFLKLHIESSFTKKVKSSILYKLMITIGVCVGVYYGPLLGFHIHYFLFGLSYALLATGWLIAGVPIFGFLGYYIPHKLIQYFIIETITSTITAYITNIISIYKVILVNIGGISDASEILKKLQTIPGLFQELKRVGKYMSFFDSENSQMMINIHKNDREVILSVIQDSISDLQIRLAEQQQTLEQAKSEVEKTVKGSTELNQVSELQQARLDQQIEQFEELQKVLIKG